MQRGGALERAAPLACQYNSRNFPDMTRNELLDLYFMDSRAKLIDIAAFLDRVDGGTGEADFRLAAFREALKELAGIKRARAKGVLLSLSDPTTEPIEKSPGKGAVGAWPGNTN